jgi:endoglucanase
MNDGRSTLSLALALALAAPSALAAPKVNQVGYLPSDDKGFHVTEGTSARAGDPFSVLDAATQATVATGLLGAAFDDTASSGESVLHGDFSAITAPGRYVVSVNGAASPPFAIAGDLYRPLFRDALRAFYLIRCGVAIDDPETGIQHAACHTSDAVLRDDPSKSEALAGGWHNAGDFGKWTHEAAITVSDMLWLYELNPAGSSSVSAATTDANDGIPDLLHEARWGLTWLLTMQQPDGSAFHKVDTEPNFAWGLPPEADPNLRKAGLASTVDAADFAAVMAQAARVLRPFDGAFADGCLSAAHRAFARAQANPAVGQTDIYYPDPDPSQELLWSLGEMVRATHDPALTAQLSAQIAAHQIAPVSWSTPELFGYAAVALDPSGDAALAATATAKISALCDGIVAAAAGTGYGVATGPSQYWWESNESLLYRTAALLFGDALTKTPAYRTVALGQLAWLLGDNGLSQSFVTGYGQNPVAAPFHWTYYALHRLMPGWATGGPNSYPSGADPLLQALIAQGTPPAKCYVDQCTAVGSYASNEGETAENGALLFVTGYFVQGETADAGAGGGTAPRSSGCACAMEKAAAPRAAPVWLLALALASVALGAPRRPCRASRQLTAFGSRPKLVCSRGGRREGPHAP